MDAEVGEANSLGITARCQLDLATFKQGILLSVGVYSPRWPGNVIMFICLCLGLAFFETLLFSGVDQEQPWWLWLLAIALTLGPILFALRILSLKWQVSKRYRQDPLLHQKKYQVNLKEKGFSFVTDAPQESTKWEDVANVIMDREMIIVNASPEVIFYLPRSAFEYSQEFQQVKDWMQAKVKKVREYT